MRRLFVTVLLLAAPTALSAPSTPLQTVKYRQTEMKLLGGHMKALGAIVKGESDRVSDVLMHAEAVAALSKTVGAMFPDGTGPGPGIETESKAEIWTQKEKFAAAVKALEDSSAALVEAAKSNDPAKVKAAAGTVGQACGDCHDAFKVDDAH